MPNDYFAQRRYLILNIINHLGPISRTELTAITDYRPATIGAIIKELLQEGLIVESGYSSSPLGRKRVLLTLNYERICAVALAFGTDSITYTLTQFNGVILHEHTAPLPSGQPRPQLIDQIIAETRALLARYPERKIVGIGICNPAYDPTRYRTDSTLLLGYGHYNEWIVSDLVPRMEAATGLAVSSFSAVTLPALVEQRYGAAQNVQNFICVELSNGIGASICCNGTPVAGAAGVAGELGHTVVDRSGDQNQLCYCGKPGCVESSTAYPALVGSIRKALERGVFSVLGAHRSESRSIGVQDIRRALDEGDQMCIYYVKRAADQIGLAIANMVNLLNPEMVVLYGFMLGLGDVFLHQLEASIRENVLVLARDFSIRISETLEDVLPLGAAAEMFSAFIKMGEYSWVYQLQKDESGDFAPMDEEQEG